MALQIPPPSHHSHPLPHFFNSKEHGSVQTPPPDPRRPQALRPRRLCLLRPRRDPRRRPGPHKVPRPQRPRPSRRLRHRMVQESHHQKSLASYKRYAYQNAMTEDLRYVLAEESGMLVKMMMETWTKQKGYPVVNIKYSDRILEFEQVHNFYTAGPVVLPSLFPFGRCNGILSESRYCPGSSEFSSVLGDVMIYGLAGISWEGSEIARSWLKSRTDEKADEMENFFQSCTAPSISRASKQSMEQVRVNAKWASNMRSEHGIEELIVKLAQRNA